MKLVVITGATGGLGQAITKTVLDSTDYGVVSISRKTDYTDINILNKYKDRLFHIQYDLKNVEGIKNLFLKQISVLGEVYALINNSAVAYDDLVTNMNIDKLNEMYNVNVFSPINLTKYAIRNMILNNIQGSIVNISSVCVYTGYKGLSMYASTKGALEAFTKNVAREWGSKGIRINAVAPGFMETKISSSITDEQRKKIYKRTSLKRATDLQFVANTVLLLLENGSITGSTINVDCGTK